MPKKKTAYQFILDRIEELCANIGNDDAHSYTEYKQVILELCSLLREIDIPKGSLRKMVKSLFNIFSTTRK